MRATSPQRNLGELHMRKWLIPLMVLGAGGVSAFLLTDRGRATLRSLLAQLNSAPERWDVWNENALTELERIQAAVNQIAQSLEPRSGMAH